MVLKASLPRPYPLPMPRAGDYPDVNEERRFREQVQKNEVTLSDRAQEGIRRNSRDSSLALRRFQFLTMGAGQ